MEKRLLLALAASFFVMLVYSLYLSRISSVPPQETADYRKGSVEEKREEKPASFPPAKPETSFRKRFPPESPAAFAEKEQTVATDKYLLKFSSRGGSIREIKLREYYADPQAEEFLTLASGEDPFEYALSLSDLDSRFELTDAEYAVEKEGKTIIFTRRLDDNLSITKQFSFFPDDYGINLTVAFTNNGEREETVSYRIISGTLSGSESALSRRFVEVSALAEGEILRRPEDIRDSRRISWIGLKNRHFSLVLAPEPSVRVAGGFSPSTRRWGKASKPAAGLDVAGFTIPAQRTVAHRFVFYAGPNDEAVLKAFGLGLERVVDYGKLDRVCRLLLRMLRFINGRVKNYGLAIILLTLTVNLVLFPVTRYNQLSMRKMQTKTQPLQPEIARLRERYRDNPRKMQQETMELYRKHGVHPLGGMGGCGKGCLTMILQMPIFISLYLVLMKSVELRGATFLWVKDLSMPDAAFSLAFKLPLLNTNAVNVLPILTTAAMFFQQKLSASMQSGASIGGQLVSDEQQKQQKLMGTMMALFFGFLFYNFPAGFNLYVLTNMVCMSAVQASLRGKHLTPEQEVR